MNAVELVFPDGTGSGGWACSNCRMVHASVTAGNRPCSEANQRSAELCCVPNNCSICGQPVPITDFGFAPWWHDECMTQYRAEHPPEPPHPSMEPLAARQLAEYMSNISEDQWCAGWLIGLEFILWSELKKGPENSFLTMREMSDLRTLSEAAGGWVVWGEEHDRRCVPMAEWEAMYAKEQR